MRIGTFQRLAALGDTETMERLVNYCLTILYNEMPNDNPAAQLLNLAVERIADLADVGKDSIGLQLEEARLPQRVRSSKPRSATQP